MNYTIKPLFFATLVIIGLGTTQIAKPYSINDIVKVAACGGLLGAYISCLITDDNDHHVESFEGEKTNLIVFGSLSVLGALAGTALAIHGVVKPLR